MKSLITTSKLLIIMFTIFSYAKGNVIARIVKIEGDVCMKRLGMSTYSEKVKTGAAIINGDAIKVGAESFAAIIYIDDRSVIKIKENSKFSFMDSKNTRTVDLVHGTLLNNIKSEGRKKAFRIQTPVSVASIKGTEFAAVVSQKGLEEFICKKGNFEVLNMISGQTVSVSKGQKAFSNATGDLVQAIASPKDYPTDPEIENDLDDLENLINNEEDNDPAEKQKTNNTPKLEQKSENSKVEMEKKIKEFISSGIEWLPINKISLNKEKVKFVLDFLEKLEDDDDVQHVYANLKIDNNFMDKHST